MKKGNRKFKHLTCICFAIFIVAACGSGWLNDKTKELSQGYIARVDGGISYILPDNIFNEGIYPNVIDFAYNEDFILVFQVPSKEHFITFLAQDIRIRFIALANVQNTSDLSKEDYELMKINLLADSSFYRMLTKELSPNNTPEDIKKSEDIAKDIIFNSDYYRSILEKDTCFWILSHIDKRKYGPFSKMGLFDKAKELNVPEELQQEFKGYTEL